MPPRKATHSTWIPIAWTILVAMVAFIFSLGGLYATINSTLSAHNKSIDDLTNVLKKESEARVAMEKTEATKRDELRKEYLGLMKDQTQTFGQLSDKLVVLVTSVEVMKSQYQTMGENVKKVIEQTAPHQTGTTGRR